MKYIKYFEGHFDNSFNDEGEEYNILYPIDGGGMRLSVDSISATDIEISKLKEKGLAHYHYDFESGSGQWEYIYDKFDEIEEYLELIRSDYYKSGKKYNL